MYSTRVIHWYTQRITGAALLLLLIMHFWVEHFAADVRCGELTFDLIQARFFRNPWFVAVDISFLLIALYHGLNGLRNILFDYSWFGRGARRVVTVFLVLLGVAWAYWGITAFVGNPHMTKGSEVQLASFR